MGLLRNAFGPVSLPIQVMISVLVVSCPCASGVALPLAAEIATARMRDGGVFVRDGGLWTRLLKVRRIAFDKTGTLTGELLQIRNPEVVAELSPDALKALMKLVTHSLHPVAVAVREALGVAPSSVLSDAADAVEEVIGMGLECRTSDGAVWRLGRPAWAKSEPISTGEEARTLLTQSGFPVAAFTFVETPRFDAAVEIRKLQESGRSVVILSGDHPQRVKKIASVLGLSEETALGGLTPTEKAQWLRAHGAQGDTLMLGDSANDALAFGESLCCGTPAVDRGVLEHRADFYYLGRGLEGIGRLLEMAALKRRVTRRVLLFTTLYNIAAISVSLAGGMHPLLAAVLMPLSSLASMALVFVGFRAARSLEFIRSAKI